MAGGSPETVSIETGIGTAAPASVKSKATARAGIEITWKGRFSRTALVQVQRFNPDLGMWVTFGNVSTRGGKLTDTRRLRRKAYTFCLRTARSTVALPFVTTTATTR